LVLQGTVTYVAPAGQYNVNEELIEVDFMGQKKVTRGDWLLKITQRG
jgi:hypothetical protein